MTLPAPKGAGFGYVGNPPANRRRIGEIRRGHKPGNIDIVEAPLQHRHRHARSRNVAKKSRPGGGENQAGSMRSQSGTGTQSRERASARCAAIHTVRQPIFDTIENSQTSVKTWGDRPERAQNEEEGTVRCPLSVHQRTQSGVGFHRVVVGAGQCQELAPPLHVVAQKLGHLA